MEKSLFTLVHICALGRSGSTMLDLMLGNHDSAFSCGEIYAHFRPWRKHHFDIDCACGDGACRVWKELADVKAKDFYREIIKTQHVTHIIDSSKELSWLLDSSGFALDNGGRVAVILLWKHPDQLAYSYWKRGRSYSMMREDFVRYYGRFLRLGIPYLSLSHQDLVANPSGVLESLCQWTGLKYFNGMEKFWEGRCHHLFGSAGTRRQTEENQGSVERTIDYPDKFIEYLYHEKGCINNDDLLNQLISKIEMQNMDNIEKLPDIITENNVLPSKIRPAWYYIRRARLLQRKYFHDRSLEKGVEGIKH